MNILKDSSAYEIFLAEGKLAGVRNVLLRMGRKRLGPPDEATAVSLKAINDLERLERMSERLLEATTWQELLATS